MIITRWQAPALPSKNLLTELFAAEGLDPIEEVYAANEKIPEHRHPFCEVRVVVSGEMLFNIAGNQFLLRPGDRVEVPANTKHSHTAQGEAGCTCLCGMTPA